MISAWALMSIVPLIGSNWYALKQIDKLRNALSVRRTLMGDPERMVGKSIHMVAGDTVRLHTKEGQDLFDIEVSNPTVVTVKSYV